MASTQSYHSVCRWTFNPGKGGFVPGYQRPGFAEGFDSVSVVKLIKEKVAPRMPDYITLGLEVHYDREYDEKSAPAIADALKDAGIYLAMATPGGHFDFGYGGIVSLDPDERKKADEFGIRAVDVAYDAFKDVLHPEIAPTMVLWNGSWGYDMATIGIQKMYENLKESVAGLCKHEAEKGGDYYIAIEPKPNEGHPAMLIPTVASALLFWRKLEDEYGIPRAKKGVNKEFGHSEMIGLDHVYDSVEELDDDGMVHVHLNSQGYNDGITLGGPGKFDIDNPCRINGMNIAIAGLMQKNGYVRWKGHDIQARPYDNEEQAVDRLIRSILNWEACEEAARQLDTDQLMAYLGARETGKAEDMMRHAVVEAHKRFDEMYG
jgi:xylose isomerase